MRRVPVPLTGIARTTSIKTHSREQHLESFAEMLDAVLFAGRPMMFVYVGGTGDDPTHGFGRFRGLEARYHADALAVAMLAAAKGGGVSRERLAQLCADVIHQMDEAGWPEPQS